MPFKDSKVFSWCNYSLIVQALTRGLQLWRHVSLLWCIEELHPSACLPTAEFVNHSLSPVSQQKLWELAKQVSEFLVWRQVICPFDRDRRVLQYLVTTPVFTEDGQHVSSVFDKSDGHHV